jgi:hypothetical protein
MVTRSVGEGVGFMKAGQTAEKRSEEARELLSFETAMHKIGAPKEVFNALVVSGLLGDYTEHGIPTVGIEHFERFGTQWRPELGERLPPDLDLSFPQGFAGHQPPNTYTQIQISPYTNPQVVDSDTGWISQFYLRPNRYFYPDRGALALIGPLFLELGARREVEGATLPTYLYPDPSGFLAMALVNGLSKPGHNPFEIAYDIVVPILDELSARYDQPLPIAHSLVVGVPSGVITIDVSKHPKRRAIAAADSILVGCPYPELQDAVALYREGISSNNPFHQFLTLWRVYENATKIRGEWRKQHKRKDTRVCEEVFPDLFAFEPVKGQTFDHVKQNLSDAYRNAIAHGGLSGNRPRTGRCASDYVDVCTKVPLLRYMAHVLLENVRATLSSTTAGRSA